MFSLSPRVQAILLTVGIFAIGLVCGAIAERRFLRQAVFMRDGRPPSGRSGRPDNRIIERLSRDLKLSEEQKNQVQAAFRQNGQEVDNFRRQINDHMRSQEQKFFDQIKGILTEEQFAKFEEMHRRRGFRGRGGRGGRGGGRRGPPGGRPPSPQGQ